MIESGESANWVATSSTVGAVAPSCYRVSVLSGSLEVSARLKNGADLELFIRVLEANKVLFANEDQLVETPGTMQGAAKPDQPKRKMSAKANQSRRELAFADQSEVEILTLT
jgi:hypothetical protein